MSFFAVKVAAMLGSPVATQRYMYPSEFQESHVLRFYRYHGPDKKIKRV